MDALLRSIRRGFCPRSERGESPCEAINYLVIFKYFKKLRSKSTVHSQDISCKYTYTMASMIVSDPMAWSGAAHSDKLQDCTMHLQPSDIVDIESALHRFKGIF